MPGDQKIPNAEKRIWIGNALVILAWPVGILFGELLSRGQDDAGAGMAVGMGLFLVLAVVYTPVAITLAVIGKRSWSDLSGFLRFLAFGPSMMCALGILLVGGLYVAELLYAALQ